MKNKLIRTGENGPRRRRRWFARFVLSVNLLVFSGCDRENAKTLSKDSAKNVNAASVSQQELAIGAPDSAETLAFIDRLKPQVESFCGDCHATPRAESIVKEDWPRETAQGYMFYRKSGRSDLKVPDQDEVTKYFVELAPSKLTMPTSITGNPPSRLNFQSLEIARRPGGTVVNRPPCISHICWADLDDAWGSSLVFCDLSTGSVNRYQPMDDNSEIERLATLYQPVHAEPCDLDGDSNQDLVVADLGEFLAADSDLGRVVWLRRLPNSNEFATVVLQDGLGRVADVRPGDFDVDGDIDLLVAEFGWRDTGSLFLLENQGSGPDSKPTFARKEIDKRHGASHIPTVDFNGDGKLDFIALISQEFEQVVAFINNGKGGFDSHTVWAAPDPTYGSSGIQIVDVDGDNDVDVVYCNGDSFDHGPKPYHSVQWLENRGEFPFVHHPLSPMPGVLAVDSGDYDGDGDVDIVAAAMLPPTLNQELARTGVESIVLFEQMTPGIFVRTWIEKSQCNHGAIASGDFDSDGTLDIAVGNFFRDNEMDRPDITLWRSGNRLTTSKRGSVQETQHAR